jgi:hypothetical protein
MATTWKSIFKETPIDGQVVWVRVQWFFGYPVVCSYDLTLQQFTDIDTGIVIPAYVVGRWRDYTGDSYEPIGVAKVGLTLKVG